MTTPSDTAEIRAVLDGMAAAHRDKDAAAILAPLTADAVICDLAPPLGHAPDRDGLAAWLATWDGPIEVTSRDLVIEVDGDIAFTHGLEHVSATTLEGEHAAWWMRTTNCLRRIEGRWRVVHQHSSVPFHMDGSFRAAVDLEP